MFWQRSVKHHISLQAWPLKSLEEFSQQTNMCCETCSLRCEVSVLGTCTTAVVRTCKKSLLFCTPMELIIGYPLRMRHSSLIGCRSDFQGSRFSSVFAHWQWNTRQLFELTYQNYNVRGNLSCVVRLYDVWLLNNETRAQLLTLTVNHQSKYMLVTVEPSPSHVSNHAPLRWRSVQFSIMLHTKNYGVNIKLTVKLKESAT
jgi:hypothetical protein